MEMFHQKCGCSACGWTDLPIRPADWLKPVESGTTPSQKPPKYPPNIQRKTSRRSTGGFETSGVLGGSFVMGNYKWSDAEIQDLKKSFKRGNETPASIKKDLGWEIDTQKIKSKIQILLKSGDIKRAPVRIFLHVVKF
jgi:hypothetical protein